ncbi:MAG: hypothetical protein Q7R33_06685, partial [Nitrosarchaeum sp.]|nr:hypothetical protein [Nitrosarchaeum sp.]
STIKIFDPLLTKSWGSFDPKNNIQINLDENNIKQSIRLGNPSIQCTTNRTIFEMFSGPYYTEEVCRTTSPLSSGFSLVKNAQKIAKRNIPQRLHNTQYETEKPAFITDYESFYGIKTKRMQYVDDAIISTGTSEFGDDGSLFFACKTCTMARNKIVDERRKYVESKGCAVP